MKMLLVIGVILAVLGLVAIAVPSLTYSTTERVADEGFFKIDISRPHTIVCGVALVVGIMLVLVGLRSNSA